MCRGGTFNVPELLYTETTVGSKGSRYGRHMLYNVPLCRDTQSVLMEADPVKESWQRMAFHHQSKLE